MWDFDQPYFEGKLSPAEQAWRTLDDWHDGGGFHLKDATFTHGPMQIFPRWPMGPMVEVMAIQGFLQTGDWLMPAEGMRPEALPPQSLPA